MRGMEAAATLVAYHLAEGLVAKVPELRERLLLDAETLPEVAVVDSVDRVLIELNDWPAVLVVGQETLGFVMVDRTDEGERYAVTYRLRTFIFARAHGEQAVARIRDRLTLGVREILLERPSVGDSGARMNPASLRESYSDVAPDEDARSIAASYLEFSITLDETVAVAGRGVVTEAVATVQPAHPALD